MFRQAEAIGIDIIKNIIPRKYGCLILKGSVFRNFSFRLHFKTSISKDKFGKYLGMIKKSMGDSFVSSNIEYNNQALGKPRVNGVLIEYKPIRVMWTKIDDV